MEFLPVSIIIGYACAHLNRKDLPLLAVFILLVPVALVGFQSANSPTPTISTQQYSELQHMATLVSSNNSVLVVQGNGYGLLARVSSQSSTGLKFDCLASEWLQRLLADECPGSRRDSRQQSSIA